MDNSKSVLASLKQRLADVPRREEALRRQLAARTEQLEAMQRGPQLLGASNGSAGGVLTGGRASPPMCRGGGGGGEAGTTPGEQAAAMAEAVAKAVAVERERWVNVSAAVEEVQVSRLGGVSPVVAHHAINACHSLSQLLREKERR